MYFLLLSAWVSMTRPWQPAAAPITASRPLFPSSSSAFTPTPVPPSSPQFSPFSPTHFHPLLSTQLPTESHPRPILIPAFTPNPPVFTPPSRSHPSHPLLQLFSLFPSLPFLPSTSLLPTLLLSTPAPPQAITFNLIPSLSPLSICLPITKIYQTICVGKLHHTKNVDFIFPKSRRLKLLKILCIHRSSPAIRRPQSPTL